MSDSRKKVVTDWKRLWQLVSGIQFETPENIVRDELLSVSKELQDGLLQFRPTSASNIKLENLLKGKRDEKLLPFTLRLQELVDLESEQCWDILCYYLANEYRGTASSLVTLTSTENNMTKLLDDIWGYYTLERMIVLKIVKNLLIYFKSSNHPYRQEYKKILDKITLEKLRESYLTQLEHLINETPPSKLSAGEFFNYHAKLMVWSERNAREINEVLHILLLIAEHVQMGFEEVKRLFACFKQHSFGKQQPYLDPTQNMHAELITRLSYSEVILFLKCIDFEDPNDALTQQIVEALDKEMRRLCHNLEHGPLLLGWMIFNLRCAQDDTNEEHVSRNLPLGKRAMELNCFSFLRDLLANVMFKDDTLLSRTVRKTVYNLLTYMCNIFDDVGCSRHPFVYELLAELLSWPALAEEFSKQDGCGTHLLYSTLSDIFPLDFIHISMLAKALTKGGASDYIKSQLESLPILTDLYDECKYALRAIGENEYVLTKSVCPYPRIDFAIAAGTTAVVTSRPEGYCVHFRTPVNYFHVLHHEMNCLLAETTQLYGDFQGNQRIRRVNAGLQYLELVLQRTKTVAGISAEMVHPTEMCIELLNKFRALQHPPVELLTSCLNVCTALLPLADEEIFTRVVNLNMLPVLTTDVLGDYKTFALGVYFDSRLVGSYLVDMEELERYNFLLAYLRFLRKYTKLQRNRFLQMEIPGLVFLLREVFPYLHSWRFGNQTDKNRIYAEIMGFICDVLDAVTLIDDKDTKENKEKRLLRDICVYSLLNLENGLVLLRFVALGNAYLQHTMEMESNWMVPNSHGLVFLVRLAMRILMHLLRLKRTIFGSDELSPLEALIYTQPKQRDTLRIIPVVTSYMSNIFDRWLPILSCRLLKRIALEFNMSLLACLDMEPDQIRLTFLQKLPDELESDSLKIAIIELVEACIEKQPGVTEAFFKVNYAPEKRLFDNKTHKQISNSILTYIEEYLEAVGKEPAVVEHPLPSKIMNLFHSLWKRNMQILVEDLTGKPEFWTKLSKPLFSELGPNVRVYTQLLNIISIEIFSTVHKSHSELKKVVRKLLEQENFKKWLDYLFRMPKTPFTLPISNDIVGDDMPEWLCRVQAFKDFVQILLKKQPQFVDIPQKQMKLFGEKCLHVMVERSHYTEDLRPFILLSELYLYILQSLKNSYTETVEEDRQLLQQIIEILNRVSCCYEDLHVRAKEACLSISIKCAGLLSEQLQKDSTVALSFLHSVVNIICIELQYLEHNVKIEIQTKKNVEPIQHCSTNSLTLSLNLLNTVATIFHNDGPGKWDLPFITNKVFQRLLSCAGAILPLYSKQNLSVELLEVLIVLAKGNCSAEFLHCDVGDYLWLKLLPPKELLQSNYTLTKPSEDEWTVQKWWPVYANGIELVTILLQKHQFHFLTEALQFVGIHEEYLMDSLLLGKQSLEPLAMKLIKNAVTLVAHLVDFQKQWRLDHSHSLFNLMRSVQMLMGHCISMFHQPKNLKCLVAGRRSQLEILRDSENVGLVDEAITALNDLTEIIILCVKCLQRFSPTLFELICEPELVCAWEPIFEIHFGAPKLSANEITLTFGTVLSVVGVYTKVLNLQNYGFHEVPLNELPTSANVVTSTNNTITPSATTYTQTQRSFNKSVSVASISSVNCPPNELLSSLDGALCLMALEHILTLAASQSMLALKNSKLPPREKQLIKREISTELLTYHEFVRKKVLIDFREHKEIWHRRKHGQVPMTVPRICFNRDVDAADIPSTSSASVPSTRTRSSSDTNRRQSMELRVNVMRRLYLQNMQQRTPAAGQGFDMSNVISPIGTEGRQQHAGPAIASTPHLINAGYGAQAQAEDVEDEEIEYFPPEQPTYSPLSYVQLVEEDYLHFMSNLFTVICQTD